MDPFIGEIRPFAFGTIPTGWKACDGSLLPITGNEQLFSLLGKRYGGNGTTNFALPDLRGTTPVGVSSDLPLAGTAGKETVTLVASQMSNHVHALWVQPAPSAANQKPSPAGAMLCSLPTATAFASATGGTPAWVTLNAGTLTQTGGSAAHNNLQPYLAVSFCIAVVGAYPSRP